MALLQKKRNIVHFCFRKWVIAVHKNEKLRHVFQQIMSFLFWLDKIKESFYCKIFFFGFPILASLSCPVQVKTNFLNFSKVSHMIKCLLTELVRPGGKIFGSHSWHKDLTVPSLYIMSSSQIIIFLSCPLTQFTNTSW